MVGRILKLWRCGGGVRPRQRQVGIAIAIAVAGATGELRIAEGHELSDRRDAAVLYADFFEMWATILGCAVRGGEGALDVLRRGTAAAVRGSGAIKDELLHRGSVAVTGSTFFKKWAGHKSLPRFFFFFGLDLLAAIGHGEAESGDREAVRAGFEPGVDLGAKALEVCGIDRARFGRFANE